VCAPSQEPPQSEPSLEHAGRAPCGLPETATHWPALPGTSQAWHWPSQAWLQQTPSAQLPFAHWLAAEQLAPSASFGTQTPAEHQSPATQSASIAQLPRQALAPHTYGAQACVCAAGQAPAPLQPAGRVAVPAAQLAPRQLVAAWGYAQAAGLAPSHAPPQKEPSVRHAARAPCGAPATAVHEPTLPGTSHAWHWPLQA